MINHHACFCNTKKKLGTFKTKGGTEVEEIEEGSGRVAKAGKKVRLYYRTCSMLRYNYSPPIKMFVIPTNKV